MLNAELGGSIRTREHNVRHVIIYISRVDDVVMTMMRVVVGVDASLMTLC